MVFWRAGLGGLFLLEGRSSLLLQPGTVVAFPGDAVAAVQFEDPLRRVVEEVAVVGHGHHGARELVQELLQPLHAFRVEVVGGLVQQRHIPGLDSSRRHSATRRFSPPDSLPTHRVPGRQAQGVGGDFHLVLDIVGAAGRGGGDDDLQLRPARPPGHRNPHPARRRRRRPRQGAAWR